METVMKKSWIICLALLTLVAMPVMGQEEILGFFEGVEGA